MFCEQVREDFFHLSAGATSIPLCSWFCLSAYAMRAAKDEWDKKDEEHLRTVDEAFQKALRQARVENEAPTVQQCPHCFNAF